MLAAYAPPVILLHIILSILSGRQKPLKLLWILLLSFLTLYSFGNGIAAVFIAILYILHKLVVREMPWRYVVAYQSIFVGLLVLGLLSFDPGEAKNMQPVELNDLGSLKAAILFAFAFIGSVAKYLFGQGNQLAAIVGFSVVIGSIIFFVKAIKSKQVPVYFYLLTFLFASATLAGWGRCGIAMYCTPLSDRYEIYGVFALLYFVFFLKSSNLWIRSYYPVLLVVIVISVLKYEENIRRIKNQYYVNAGSLANYVRNEAYTRVIYKKEMRTIENILSDSKRLNTYLPPAYLFNSSLEDLTKEELVPIENKDIIFIKANYENSFLKGNGIMKKGQGRKPVYFETDQGFVKLNLHSSPIESKQPGKYRFFFMNKLQHEPDEMAPLVFYKKK
jgi:hypothetical protein